MAFIYVPNGANMPDWTPKTEGSNFELPYILQPLQEFKSDLNVLSGLTQDSLRRTEASTRSSTAERFSLV